jgi:hypothetical protein
MLAGGDFTRIKVKMKLSEMLIDALQKDNITKQGYNLW